MDTITRQAGDRPHPRDNPSGWRLHVLAAFGPHRGGSLFLGEGWKVPTAPPSTAPISRPARTLTVGFVEAGRVVIPIQRSPQSGEGRSRVP